MKSSGSFLRFNAKAIRRISVDLKAWTAATQSAAAWETMLAFQAKGMRDLAND